jgi:hypothetical protein
VPVFEALSISKQKGFSNILVNHHIWPDKMEQIFSHICEMVLYPEHRMGSNHPRKCATELCIDRFAPTNSCAKTLGFIAHRTGFPDSARFPFASAGQPDFLLFRKESVELQYVRSMPLFEIIPKSYN